MVKLLFCDLNKGEDVSFLPCDVTPYLNATPLTKWAKLSPKVNYEKVQAKRRTKDWKSQSTAGRKLLHTPTQRELCQ